MKTPEELREEARSKALDSLARYKFVMFGYWAGVWVHANHMAQAPAENPFRGLVQLARQELAEGTVGGNYSPATGHALVKKVSNTPMHGLPAADTIVREQEKGLFL